MPGQAESKCCRLGSTERGDAVLCCGVHELHSEIETLVSDKFVSVSLAKL